MLYFQAISLQVSCFAQSVDEMVSIKDQIIEPRYLQMQLVLQYSCMRLFSSILNESDDHQAGQAILESLDKANIQVRHNENIYFAILEFIL